MKKIFTPYYVGACMVLLSAVSINSGCHAQTQPAALNDAIFPITDAVHIQPRAGFAARMIDGEIQGSNESATGGFETLARITQAPPEGEWTVITFKNSKPFRFLRYFGPDGSYANIAELEFWSGKSKIVGTPYGTFGSRENNGNVFGKAFDSDAQTFFDAAAPNSQYLGIDLQKGGAIPETIAPVVIGNGLRAFHIGNSLTDGMGEYTRELAIAAGFKDHFMDRQTIPGAPLWLNFQSDGGFGTNYKTAFDKFAPLTDLVMQTFISNGDSDDPEFSLKFYDVARAKSPQVRPWIYGQWIETARGEREPKSTSWEQRNRALMQVYVAHALNFNAQTKGKKTQVIPGGLALSNLKSAFDAGSFPDLGDFYATNFADDLHLSEAGRQFIGMVIFSSLYGQSPVGLPIVKINENAPKLTAEQNRIYQQVAWDTVQNFKKDGGASLGSMLPGEIDARAYVRGEIPYRNSRLQYIDENKSFLYLLNAPRAGQYDFVARAVIDSADKNLLVFVNHQSAGQVIINPVKDGALAADSTVLSVDLKAGLNLLRVQVPFGRAYDLQSFKVTYAGEKLTNTSPILDLNAWEEEIKAGETSFTCNFKVEDLETLPDNIQVSASSDNAALVPDSAIEIEKGEFKDEWGNIYNRRLIITPVQAQKGDARISVIVSDDAEPQDVRLQSFNLKVR